MPNIHNPKGKTLYDYKHLNSSVIGDKINSLTALIQSKINYYNTSGSIYIKQEIESLKGIQKMMVEMSDLIGLLYSARSISPYEAIVLKLTDEATDALNRGDMELFNKITKPLLNE